MDEKERDRNAENTGAHRWGHRRGDETGGRVAPPWEHGRGGRHRKQFEQGRKGDELLKVNDLVVEYTSNGNTVHAVNHVSFEIRRGESLGLVGESGCGKSTIAKAILRILPDRAARIAGGEVLYRGEDLTKLSSAEMQKIRGAEIAMIFQDPMTALNPVRRILKQVTAVIALHNPELSRREVEARAIRVLKRVGIAPDRVRQYPHQFSGGMQQRVEIAIGLSCHPDLLLADEPTTALDVTMQAQALDLIKELMEENNTALLLITHNLGIVAEVCDNVAVIYGGEIVEYGSKREIFKNPSHPYTIGLFGALPDTEGEKEHLTPIEGIMPEPSELPTGCKFHTRCPYADEQCAHGFTPGMENSWASGTKGFRVTLQGKSFVPGGDAMEETPGSNDRPGVYTWQENESAAWTLQLHKKGGYTLSKSVDGGECVEYSGELWYNKGDVVSCAPLMGRIPVVDLGGTHRCQCCRLDAVRAAREKEAAV